MQDGTDFLVNPLALTGSIVGAARVTVGSPIDSGRTFERQGMSRPTVARTLPLGLAIVLSLLGLHLVGCFTAGAACINGFNSSISGAGGMINNSPCIPMKIDAIAFGAAGGLAVLASGGTAIANYMDLATKDPDIKQYVYGGALVGGLVGLVGAGGSAAVALNMPDECK